ncbi:putative 1-hydroxycarotenoid 3,4-desaturase [Rosa chinensis]|uniref:Putative 1-hydroxycarotenoid 3,4-desaturase n=1 Tax=Rosa chinensis TaxID=74649 RepID=A0A2P6QTT1_ROSCH|nr:putative 1-hydroxycarotenoid 3,4-desaturase [Rosa chinensis]
MKVALIGSGISGLVSAYFLAKGGVEVVLYEKKDYPGDHGRTVTYDGVDLDLSFMVFNHISCATSINTILKLALDSLY